MKYVYMYEEVLMLALAIWSASATLRFNINKI